MAWYLVKRWYNFTYSLITLISASSWVMLGNVRGALLKSFWMLVPIRCSYHSKQIQYLWISVSKLTRVSDFIYLNERNDRQNDWIFRYVIKWWRTKETDTDIFCHVCLVSVVFVTVFSQSIIPLSFTKGTRCSEIACILFSLPWIKEMRK
jgi:hypothetical protein